MMVEITWLFIILIFPSWNVAQPAGYDFLPHLAQNTAHYLALFVQYEDYNTQNEIPEGFSKNPALARTNISMGLKYKPHPHVGFKFDYIVRRNDAKTGVDQINLAINYLF